MTVAELITELSKLDPTARVVIIDGNRDDDSEANNNAFPVLCCTEYEPGEITLEY
jgi:hypothetical protein